ncbi:hypothetical protein Cri9333_0531 [Crinalium epipsammum PCC 9333]|uniref:Chromosome segregation ATPase n=1 Tax=Crinalium epipsammum PCC 9333 TaxID=1173022 RepID=K9VU48_9CYAN|nr:hypothetical protein [Crinalium epipsammum]AFZ11486.1 hypothetical protein Cri9333_0531 [Crinalium epipsammum PCC 9333]
MFKLSNSCQKKTSLHITNEVKDSEYIAPTDEVSKTRLQSSRRSRIPWQLWVSATLILSGSLSFIGVSVLLKLPSAPNCPKIFMLTASASMRLYCAELAASKQTVDNLIEAIGLISTLPANHAMHSEIERRIEKWSRDILRLADNSFQEGKLDEAIAAAKKIPEHPKVTPVAIAKIEEWQLIWSTAQKIYDTAISYIKSLKWSEVFPEAVKLTKLGNEYWGNIKYNQLIDILQLTQKENEQLDIGYDLVFQGGVENLYKAIKIAQSIPPTSLIFKKSTDLITKSGTILVKIAKNKLNSGNWKEALSIAKNIPPEPTLEAEAKDIIDLASAVGRANEGEVSDLEVAIAMAKQLKSERPLFEQAQRLIFKWTLEITDVEHLNEGRNLAAPGGMNDLLAGISEINKIPINNPRYGEAQRQAYKWRQQIQTIEDQPILDDANALAAGNRTEDLLAAIDTAKQISSGRALYPAASKQIREWSNIVETLQDRPILEQAQGYARSNNADNLRTAISIARQITKGRALYEEASSQIAAWRTLIRQLEAPTPNNSTEEEIVKDSNTNIEITETRLPKSQKSITSTVKSEDSDAIASTNLRSAYEAANGGTVESLSRAIRTASSIPSKSSDKAEATEAINNWSEQLFAIAQSQAESNVKLAIATAKKIPKNAAIYPTVQLQLTEWEK